MQTVENISGERRVWPNIQTAEGPSLELDPGETAEVDVPEGFRDPHLKARRTKAPKQDPANQPTTEKPEAL